MSDSIYLNLTETFTKQNMANLSETGMKPNHSLIKEVLTILGQHSALYVMIYGVPQIFYLYPVVCCID